MTKLSEDRLSSADLAAQRTDELRDLVEEGSEQGYLEAAHVADVLRDLELTPAQMEEIYTVFAELGIDIIEDESSKAVAETADEETIPAKLDLSEKTQSSDPVRRYLKEIGKVPLLTPSRRSPWPSASSATTWRPSASSLRPTCASWSPSPSVTSAEACRCSTSSRRATSA